MVDDVLELFPGVTQLSVLGVHGAKRVLGNMGFRGARMIGHDFRVSLDDRFALRGFGRETGAAGRIRLADRRSLKLNRIAQLLLPNTGLMFR